FVPGQASGLVAGGIIVLFFILYYAAYRLARGGKKTFETRRMRYFRKTQPELAAELSRELSSLSPRETGAMDGGPLGDTAHTVLQKGQREVKIFQKGKKGNSH
ncbi:MAG: hypothetical protein PHT34_07040, partial [Oscillospiraceae bacterium]|nr:hypothetical protein [Oscillospiraceae bacterium]